MTRPLAHVVLVARLVLQSDVTFLINERGLSGLALLP